MDMAQLIISAIAAIGSVASGAMLAWTIYMFRHNNQQQEISIIRSGYRRIEERITNILRTNKENEFKKDFRTFFSSDDFVHNIRNIYNGMQVAYKQTPIKEYIEEHIVFDPQFEDVLFLKIDKQFQDIENLFSVELKKFLILREMFNISYSDYISLKENVIRNVSKEFVIEQIYKIYYEQKNELLSYDQFIEKLSVKCAQQVLNVYNVYYEILKISLKALNIVVQELSKNNDKDCLRAAKIQLFYPINKEDFINNCDDYFKTLTDIYSELIKLYSQRELLVSKINSRDEN